MFLVLLLVAFVAATLSGAAGFGGALLLLPVLSITVGPTQAVPLLTVAQLIGNFSRMALGYRDIQWRAVGIFLATALPAAMTGALCFVSLPIALAMRGIGLGLLFFAILRWRGVIRFSRSSWLLSCGGAVVGFLSGLVGSAGPLGAAVFHALELPPLAYVATEATTALMLHVVKFAVYQRFFCFALSFWMLALALGTAMVAGTWTSRRLVERLPIARFRTFITLLLAMIGIYMLITGSP